MSFTFVLKDKGTINQGWWLKISSLEELAEYSKASESPIIRGFKSAINCREFETVEGMKLRAKLGPQPLKPHVNSEGMFLGMYAQNRGISLAEAAVQLDIDKYSRHVEFLEKGYNLYFNRYGAWHFGKDDYDDWFHSDKLIFPKFKKSQIKIEKFPMGEHYYAYIDNIQVRDGDILKWNTYEEAYAKALAVVGNQEKD